MGSLLGVHAILQSTAFLIVFPLGAIVALYRDRIGASWFRYHVALQTLGTLLVVVAVSLAIAYRVTDKHDHKEEPSRTKKRHRTNGYVVVSVLAAQWLWAVFMRGLIPWGIWLNAHMLLAVLLVSLGFYQIYLGSQLVQG